jgi:hypothetical protein
METIYKVAGIDVHKKMLAVVITDTAQTGEFRFERRKFGAGAGDLVELSDWLARLYWLRSDRKRGPLTRLSNWRHGSVSVRAVRSLPGSATARVRRRATAICGVSCVR